jgi:hypothetical protein
MSENQNMFVEESDHLDPIQKKEEILKEAKEIPTDSDYKEVMPTVTALQKKWRRLGEGESAYEEELRKQFDEVLDVFYAKQKEALKDVVNAKEELIKKAEALATSTEFNKATNEAKALFDEWKSLGRTDHKTEDELWERFNAARQKFFDAKHVAHDEAVAKMQDAAKVKEELVKKAEELSDSTEWKKTTDAMNSLMDEWKAAGFAGKEKGDELWDKFRAARQKFFDARGEFYTKQNAEFAEKVKAKEELIAKAKEVLNQNTYSRELSDKLKELQASWKEIGFSGKNSEEKLWKEFKGTVDSYYAGLKAFNEQKHTDWLNRMESQKERKADLIEKQKKQLSWMERELTSVIGESAYEEMQLDIEDKKAFIEQLEGELKELEEKIAK